MAKKVNKFESFTSTVPKNSRFESGDFRDICTPRKYIGNSPKIVYRSSYELEFMKKLEMNPTVAGWNVEQVKIPYKLLVNGVLKTKTYIMDFVVIGKTGKKFLCEVKPLAFVPKTSNAIAKNNALYMNACKWKYAMIWCKKNGYIFTIIAEKQLKMFLNFN